MLTQIPRIGISVFVTLGFVLPFLSAYAVTFLINILLFKVANLTFQFNYKEGNQLQYDFVSMTLRYCTSGFSGLSPPTANSFFKKSPF